MYCNVACRGRPNRTRTFAILSVAIALTAGCKRPPEVARIADLHGETVVDGAWSGIEEHARGEAIESTLLKAAADITASQFDRLRAFSSLADEECRELTAVVDHDVKSSIARVQADVDKTQRLIDTEFLPEWRNTEQTRLDAARRADEAERELRKAQQTALALGAENRWFWLAGLVALAAVLAVFGIDQRHAIRRYLNGGRAKGLGLGKALVAVVIVLSIVTAALFFASDGLIVDFFDPGPAGTELAAIHEEHQADLAAYDRNRKRRAAIDESAADERRKLDPLYRSRLPLTHSLALLDNWWTYWTAVAHREAQLAALEEGHKRLTASSSALDPARTGSLAAKTKENRELTAGWRRHAQLICGFIGVALISLVAIGFGGLARALRNRTQKLANTCPLCLSEGTLKPAGDNAGEGMVRCGHVISESPFEECDFEFPAMFRGVPKLCFPTLGVPSAGKTHWLAMVYRQLNRGDFPAEVEFAKLRSRSSDDFDHIVEDMLASKRGPAATQQNALPKPLVFNFIDKDRLGRSNVLVNVFDYSGEVLRAFTLDDYQRRRAFTADGYFFFLDPTKTSDEQTAPLSNFRQDVRIVKNLRAGQQIRCPVALCVPKIDLLTSQPYADPNGNDAVDHFYRDVAEIGWGLDEPSIAKRATLMRSLRDTIWPGWEIERQIDDLFGGRYMFFPFTPIGLDGIGADWTTGNRIISPVGILHPLMWLLHMNGYPVLPKHATG